VLKAISDPAIAAAADVTVFGAPDLLRRSHAELRLALGAQRRPAGWLPDPDAVKLHAVPLEPWVVPGVVPHLGTKASGEASFRFLEAAITETLAGARTGGAGAEGRRLREPQAGRPASGRAGRAPDRPHSNSPPRPCCTRDPAQTPRPTRPPPLKAATTRS
jgi:hypothetical protein